MSENFLNNASSQSKLNTAVNIAVNTAVETAFKLNITNHDFKEEEVSLPDDYCYKIRDRASKSRLFNCHQFVKRKSASILVEGKKERPFSDLGTDAHYYELLDTSADETPDGIFIPIFQRDNNHIVLNEGHLYDIRNPHDIKLYRARKGQNGVVYAAGKLSESVIKRTHNDYMGCEGYLSTSHSILVHEAVLLSFSICKAYEEYKKGNLYSKYFDQVNKWMSNDGSDYQINHLNGNLATHDASDLEFCTKFENQQHRTYMNNIQKLVDWLDQIFGGRKLRRLFDKTFIGFSATNGSAGYVLTDDLERAAAESIEKGNIFIFLKRCVERNIVKSDPINKLADYYNTNDAEHFAETYMAVVS